MENALDIAKYCITSTLAIPFSDYYFKTVEWESVALNAPSIGLYIKESTSLNEIIERIQASYINTQFHIDKESLFFTWKDFDWDGVSYLCTITPDMLLSGRTGVSPIVETTEVAAIIKIDYNQDWSKGDYATKLDKSNLTAAKRDYDSAFTLPSDYKTLLTNSTDVNTQISRLGKILWYPNTRFNISIPANLSIQSVKAFNLNAGDHIRVLANTDVKLVYGYIVAEIMKTSPDLDNNTIGLELRVEYTYADIFKQPTLIKSNFSSAFIGTGSIPITILR